MKDLSKLKIRSYGINEKLVTANNYKHVVNENRLVYAVKESDNVSNAGSIRDFS